MDEILTEPSDYSSSSNTTNPIQIGPKLNKNDAEHTFYCLMDEILQQNDNIKSQSDNDIKIHYKTLKMGKCRDSINMNGNIKIEKKMIFSDLSDFEESESGSYDSSYSMSSGNYSSFESSDNSSSDIDNDTIPKPKESGNGNNDYQGSSIMDLYNKLFKEPNDLKSESSTNTVSKMEATQNANNNHHDSKEANPANTTHLKLKSSPNTETFKSLQVCSYYILYLLYYQIFYTLNEYEGK